MTCWIKIRHDMIYALITISSKHSPLHHQPGWLFAVPSSKHHFLPSPNVSFPFLVPVEPLSMPSCLPVVASFPALSSPFPAPSSPFFSPSLLRWSFRVNWLRLRRLTRRILSFVSIFSLLLILSLLVFLVLRSMQGKKGTSILKP